MVSTVVEEEVPMSPKATMAATGFSLASMAAYSPSFSAFLPRTVSVYSTHLLSSQPISRRCSLIRSKTV